MTTICLIGIVGIHTYLVFRLNAQLAEVHEQLDAVRAERRELWSTVQAARADAKLALLRSRIMVPSHTNGVKPS